MIERRKFVTWWKRLEERFGETPGADAYLAYLESQGLETHDFEAAAAAVWATSRFFPRPADFLLVEAGRAWVVVLKNLPSLQSPDEQAWDAAKRRIPARAWDALASLGGASALLKARDITRVRRDFLDAYEMTVAGHAIGALSIEPGGRMASLLPGSGTPPRTDANARSRAPIGADASVGLDPPSTASVGAAPFNCESE